MASTFCCCCHTRGWSESSVRYDFSNSFHSAFTAESDSFVEASVHLDQHENADHQRLADHETNGATSNRSQAVTRTSLIQTAPADPSSHSPNMQGQFLSPSALQNYTNAMFGDSPSSDNGMFDPSSACCVRPARLR